jgi:signal transduction histidine kinase
MVEREGWTRPLDAPVDADLLRRAFLNLFLNAADAVESGGRLQVAARYEQACNRKCLVLSVSDDGNGISVEDSEKVANPFFTTKAKGTGLGLAVVNRIVGAHGGETKIEPRGRLGGATVEVRLPLSS